MSSSSWTANRTTLSEHPERTAWTVLLISFAIFCLLAFTIPYSITYFVQHGTRSQSARLDPTLGTLRFKPSRSAETIAVTSSRDDIREGSFLVAGDDATQGTLSFISERAGLAVLGSAQIYSGTSLEVLRIREPIFENSLEPYLVRLSLDNGQARIFNNSGNNRALVVELLTPHGKVTMDKAGAYTIKVTKDTTDFTARTGEAQLSDSAGNQTSVAELQRVLVGENGLQEAASFEEQNLVTNGEFRRQDGGLGVGSWTPYGRTQNSEVTPGDSKFLDRDGRQVLFFSRQTGANYHTEVGVSQEINQHVNVYDSLRLQFDVKLLHQRPAGGGEQGSEFPLRVEIAYTDIYDNQQTWGLGLYYLNPDDDEDPNNDLWSLDNSLEIPQGQWYSYASPNLMPLFESQGTRPNTIDTIRLYASGHKYQSIVSGVDLLAR